MNHKEKILKWIDDLGLVVIHAEIRPYGPGTRRYMIGRHIEEPTKSHQMGSGKWQMTPGQQAWLTPEPLSGIEVEKWLTEFSKKN
jgi:hypothetical protein|tara:strand:+ start:550 stop:804 length:255 start_codon:yes stop_codon:yes gene_type:complete